MMDINYILGREQISLRRAVTSGSRSARAVHRLFARSYGRLLKSGTFPHADFVPEVIRAPAERGPGAFEWWENEGGSVA